MFFYESWELIEHICDIRIKNSVSHADDIYGIHLIAFTYPLTASSATY
jgi:hypothetical protein